MPMKWKPRGKYKDDAQFEKYLARRRRHIDRRLLRKQERVNAKAVTA